MQTCLPSAHHCSAASVKLGSLWPKCQTLFSFCRKIFTLHYDVKRMLKIITRCVRLLDFYAAARRWQRRAAVAAHAVNGSDDVILLCTIALRIQHGAKNTPKVRNYFSGLNLGTLYRVCRHIFIWLAVLLHIYYNFKFI